MSSVRLQTQTEKLMEGKAVPLEDVNGNIPMKCCVEKRNLLQDSYTEDAREELEQQLTVILPTPKSFVLSKKSNEADLSTSISNKLVPLYETQDL
jgi:hypothetical protein